MKKILLLLIKSYRYLISPLLGERCRLYPSCSLYAQIAIERYGMLCGIWLVIKRLCKCHPWYRGDGYDPVPEALEKEKNNRERLYV
jgi:hypothetical protein